MKKYFFLLLLNFILIEFITGQSTDTLKNGYTIIYYKNGKVSSEGYIKNGKPDGYWKTYYTTGIIKAEGNRKSYLLDSTWLFYNSFGDTIEKINYLYGKRNGYTTGYYSNRIDSPFYVGNVVSKELYLNDKKEGLSYYYYNDGNLRRVSEYSDNKLDGLTYDYNEKGIITTILKYSKGILAERERINRTDEENLKTGTWKDFYNDLSIKREINYNQGKKDGIYKEFDQKGNLNLILKYKNDLLVQDENIEEDSIYVKNDYDKNGNLIFSGTYKSNVPVGIHRYFDSTGNVINAYIYNENGIKVSEGIINKDGSKEGKWKLFYDNGDLKAEGTYQNNSENGLWKFLYKSGKVEQEGNYKEGKYNGKWTWYYDDSKLRKEEAYYNGKEEGESVEYDKDGNIISKGEYFEGEKEGAWYYFVNDHEEIGSYVTGLRDGKWKYYFDKGQNKIEFEGNYVQGNPDGKQKYYYANGVIKEEQYYSQGIKEKHWKKYDQAGNLVITISYEDNREVRINGEKIDLGYENTKLIK